MFPERSFTALRMTISVSDAGYRNVTREHWDGRYGVACVPLWVIFL